MLLCRIVSRPRRAITDPGPHIAVPFGKYLLIKRLAVGGMAELFLAQDEPEQPLVVIKRILPYLTDDPSFVQMFLDEARIAAQLHHPNIVRVHELGKLNEAIFISMEYVEGVDLRKMLQQEQKENAAIPYAVAARIVSEVCAGLHYAHHCVGVDGRKMEIVHRDISPQNVMVGFDGQVKLVDFGIARANAFMERSKPGVLKGKFLYLSPEQVMQEPLDHRSDLFAIGTLLYEVTTGKAPFQRATPEAVLFAIRREDPPAPQLAHPDYPAELSAIVARCLTKDRNKRYQDASEIRADLEAFLAHTRQVGAPEVAEYAQLLFGDEDERTILNIPSLHGSSQATLLVAPVLARPPSRKLEPSPPPAELPSVTHPVNVAAPERPASNDVVLGPSDATPLFTPRPPLEQAPVTQPGRTPEVAQVPLEDRDTGELSISLGGNSAITENERSPRPSWRNRVEPLPPVIVSPPVPRRPTRMGQVAGAPPPHAFPNEDTRDLQPEPTGSTTQALPQTPVGWKVLIFCAAAIALLVLGALLGRLLRSPSPEAPPAGPSSMLTPLPKPPPEPQMRPHPEPSPAPLPPQPEPPSSPVVAAPEDPPASPPKPPLPHHVIFHVARGAVVEVLGHRVRPGVPVTVSPGRLRYSIRCPGRFSFERSLEVDPNLSKTLNVSARCPSKGAK